MTDRAPLDVWCPYCVAPPGRPCRTRPYLPEGVVGSETSPHADRERVARGILVELAPLDRSLWPEHEGLGLA